MSDITVTSRSELLERRRQLRLQRRWRLFRVVWQMLLAGGFAGGLVWLIAQPGWVIRDPSQISVDGTEFLAEETVRALIPLSYPRSILEVQPEAIEQHLKTRGPIANVVVSRQLFPPSLAVHIRERHPVAVLIGHSYIAPPARQALESAEPRDISKTELQPALQPNPSARTAPRTTRPSKLTPTGLIDENGTWMPLESYTNINQDLELPRLRLIGMQEEYRQYWANLYAIVQRSPVEIYEIDWRDPANLVFNTDLGIVYLGSYEAERLRQQLITLDRIRNLPQVVDLDTVEYLDLRDPNTPLLQFNPAAPQYSQTSIPVPPSSNAPLIMEPSPNTDSEDRDGHESALETPNSSSNTTTDRN